MASFSTLWLDEPTFTWLASWASIVGTLVSMGGIGLSIWAALAAGSAAAAAREARAEVVRFFETRRILTETVPGLIRIRNELDEIESAYIDSSPDPTRRLRLAVSDLGALSSGFDSQLLGLDLRRLRVAMDAVERLIAQERKPRGPARLELKNAVDEVIAALVTMNEGL